MKMFIVFVAIIACALAVPVPADDADTVIVKYESDVGPEAYKFEVETSDGQSKQEAGELKNVGTDDEGISIRGSYSFVAPDGITYTVNYIADENGFQPQGEHLPKA